MLCTPKENWMEYNNSSFLFRERKFDVISCKLRGSVAIVTLDTCTDGNKIITPELPRREGMKFVMIW